MIIQDIDYYNGVGWRYRVTSLIDSKNVGLPYEAAIERVKAALNEKLTPIAEEADLRFRRALEAV